MTHKVQLREAKTKEAQLLETHTRELRIMESELLSLSTVRTQLEQQVLEEKEKVKKRNLKEKERERESTATFSRDGAAAADFGELSIARQEVEALTHHRQVLKDTIERLEQQVKLAVETAATAVSSYVSEEEAESTGGLSQTKQMQVSLCLYLCIVVISVIVE